MTEQQGRTPEHGAPRRPQTGSAPLFALPAGSPALDCAALPPLPDGLGCLEGAPPAALRRPRRAPARRAHPVTGALRLMAPALFGLLLSLISLCSFSWGWFTDEISGSVPSLSTSTYAVTVTVTETSAAALAALADAGDGESVTETALAADGQTTPTPAVRAATAETAEALAESDALAGPAVASEPPAEDAAPGTVQYALKAGTAYTITLRPAETSTAASGYCNLVFSAASPQDDDTQLSRRTENLTGESEITFTYVPERDEIMTVYQNWGTKEGGNELIQNNEVIGILPTPAPTPETTEPAAEEPAEEAPAAGAETAAPASPAAPTAKAAAKATAPATTKPTAPATTAPTAVPTPTRAPTATPTPTPAPEDPDIVLEDAAVYGAGKAPR